MSRAREPSSAGARAIRVVASFLVGLAAFIAALVLIVVIRTWELRLVAALALWLLGVGALIVFADALNRSLPGRKDERVADALHWLSASFVALVLAVVLGAMLPSILGLSAVPSFWSALGCDALVGTLAGLGTLVLVSVSGWAGGELSFRLLRTSRLRELDPERFRWSLRNEWSVRTVLRIIVLAVVGVVASGGATQLFAREPPSAGADVAPKLPSIGSTVVLPLAVWFVATAIVWAMFEWRPRRKRGQVSPSTKHRRASHASALGFGLAILIGWGSAHFLGNVIKDDLTAHGSVPAVSVRSVPPEQQVAYLAQRFAPQFELAPGEHWDPSTVNWYVAHSQHITAQRFCAPTHREPQGCRELCREHAGISCAPRCDQPTPGECALPGGDPDAVYYLYQDASNTNDHPARPGHDWAVIEYWIFYNYDSLKAGLITQWHQSDWEQVSVLVVRHGTTVAPVEVGFSEHCYGVSAPAARVSWVGSHPVSFVGLGSHANYPTQTDVPIRQLQCLTRRTPRFLGAAGLFFNPQVAGWSVELPLAYLIGLNDTTGTGRIISDPHAISERATADVWGFHGYWGENNDLSVVAGGGPIGEGPQSPQDQGPSEMPFHDMYCNPTWIKTAPSSSTSWICDP